MLVVVTGIHMIKNFRVSNPNLFSIMLASLTAAFAFIVMTKGVAYTTSSQSVIMRTAYVAATCLLMFDVMESAYIARGPDRNRKTIHFWIYAFYMGYFWMLLMVLMNWEGIQSASRVLLTWGCAGVFFGLAMSWMGARDHAALEHRYQLDKPATGHSLGFIYYIWPVLLVAVIVGFLIFPPTSGWSENYFLFQLVLMGTVMPLYAYRTGQFWENFWPRGLGIGLLLFGLLAT
jgi:hypothetical protein